MLKYHDDVRDTEDRSTGKTYYDLKLTSGYLNLRILSGGLFKYDDDVFVQQNQVYKIWPS